MESQKLFQAFLDERETLVSRLEQAKLHKDALVKQYESQIDELEQKVETYIVYDSGQGESDGGGIKNKQYRRDILTWMPMMRHKAFLKQAKIKFYECKNKDELVDLVLDQVGHLEEREWREFCSPSKLY